MSCSCLLKAGEVKRPFDSASTLREWEILSGRKFLQLTQQQLRHRLEAPPHDAVFFVRFEQGVDVAAEHPCMNYARNIAEIGALESRQGAECQFAHFRSSAQWLAGNLASD